ncbi:Cyanovirin-N [Neurospora crassa]|uniref:Cyanovirin-N domain-containing protein n=1 Tax=Neurospora crassa (strain ATCC 24698 / 74-OR23-1A / CBS 708.71 / DSM 1257 / FGSC 987) TaxID=367110 RepID=Q7S4I2_NEUCR|nr:hypothetical protein NCU08168 [Neurospora crassa OR74A]EAA30424.3 hypothetical protein NCU08168 [Neurospora crassa OR74A]KHE80456.1 Cyanovirin-N [Neurospora crassa]|eukprot:XP_959660.3 hypothetical protein NCU08168 [Neurospora crassa OR74A]
MRPNVLYLVAILSTQAAAIEATSNEDLRPSIWCTAAFLYPGQDRLGNNALKNVFHGYCGLKGYEVSTDIDLNQCLENMNGQIKWKENGNGIGTCECRSKRNTPFVIECQCPDDRGNKRISSVNLNEQLRYENGTFKCFGASGKTEDVSYRLPGTSGQGGGERLELESNLILKRG